MFYRANVRVSRPSEHGRLSSFESTERAWQAVEALSRPSEPGRMSSFDSTQRAWQAVEL